jgi:hypothetical protein
VTADEISRAFLLEQVHDFLALEQGASTRTCEAYGRDLVRFATYARSRGATAPHDTTPRMLRDYVYHLKDLGLAHHPGMVGRHHFRGDGTWHDAADLLDHFKELATGFVDQRRVRGDAVEKPRLGKLTNVVDVGSVDEEFHLVRVLAKRVMTRLA